jgi:hypothetical protein
MKLYLIFIFVTDIGFLLPTGLNNCLDDGGYFDSSICESDDRTLGMDGNLLLY